MGFLRRGLQSARVCNKQFRSPCLHLSAARRFRPRRLLLASPLTPARSHSASPRLRASDNGAVNKRVNVHRQHVLQYPARARVFRGSSGEDRGLFTSGDLIPRIYARVKAITGSSITERRKLRCFVHARARYCRDASRRRARVPRASSRQD